MPGAGKAPRIFVAANFVMACCWRVPRLPRPGETLEASALLMEPGGKGLNVAIGARRLGAQVDVLIGVGRDAAAAQLKALLDAESMGTAHVHGLAAQSGYGAGMIGADGQNAIAVYPGPNLLLDAGHADAAEADIARADLVYGQFETSVPAVERCFALARRHGVRTVLNPSPWQAISPALLADTSVIVVNEVEAAGLLGLAGAELGGPGKLGTAEIAARLAAPVRAFWLRWKPASVTQAPLLIVTLGEHGCIAFRPDEAPLAVSAFAVHAVDTVGAGDAFAAALCMALCRGGELHSALIEANAAGALMASQYGVLGALPDSARLAAQMATWRASEIDRSAAFGDAGETGEAAELAALPENR
jgi:ribokinase